MAKKTYKADVEILGDAQLAMYWKGLPDKLKRKVVRQMIQAGGTELAGAVRKSVRREVSTEASSRGGKPRYIHGRSKPETPLAKTITTKTWSVPRKGIIGVAVGPKWPDGAQGHLVERGHQIWSHGVNTGRLSRAVRFQAKAVAAVKDLIRKRQNGKMAEAIRKEHGAAKTKGLI